MKTKVKEPLVEKIVSEEEAGTRLDRCLRLWVPGLPQGMIEKGVRKGLVRLNGEKVKPSFRVELGQRLTFPQTFLTLELKTEKKVQRELTEKDREWIQSLIIYEDKDIVVINKPSGVAVQGGTKQSKSLDAMLNVFYSDVSPKLVHRLDLETSGVLVFAKSLPMARWLTKAFKERDVKKVYWAIVVGSPKHKEGVINLPLSKKQGAESEKIRVDHETGTHAVTGYKVLENLGKQYALLELRPKTGRTHQLRVHCMEGLGTPILGDGKYGGREAFPEGRTRLHLHASMIEIPLPDGKMKSFKAPLPKDFQETLFALGFENV